MQEKRTIRKDLVLSFGDRNDGAIGIPGLTEDGKVIEISYFFGATRPKNIVVVSSQAGCPMRCSFCELGAERFARNLSAEEMVDQAHLMLAEATKHGIDIDRVPHKITIANSGESLLNPQLVEGLTLLAHLNVASLKVSTVLPDTNIAGKVLTELADFAAQEERPVQLQISLISTSEEQRVKTSGGRVANFAKIRAAGELWRAKNPLGRKVNLSLILTDLMHGVAADVVKVFPPELFRFRFREYVPTSNGDGHGLRMISPTRLAEIKKEFQQQGYEVSDWASPSPIEWKFGLAANVIRKRYLEMITPVPV